MQKSIGDIHLYMLTISNSSYGQQGSHRGHLGHGSKGFIKILTICLITPKYNQSSLFLSTDPSALYFVLNNHLHSMEVLLSGKVVIF